MGWPFRRRGRRVVPSLMDVEVREEIRFHLEMRARELQRQGLDADRAWQAALDAFGDPEWAAAQAVREGGEDDGRDGMMGWVRNVPQDFGYAVRNLRKDRGFTAVAVLTLALGIGASSAIYSVVHGVLMRPLPFDEPEALVSMWSRWVPESGYDWPKYPVGSPEYFDYKEEARTLESVAAVSTERLAFSAGTGDAEMVTAGAVSPSMFTVLRAAPLLGRTLVEADGGADPAPVVVLSYDFWQRRFGGDSTVVGRTLELGWENGSNDVVSSVVGVMPPGFSFPTEDVDLWAPLLLDPERVWREGHWFSMIGRLAPGETLSDAQVEMANIMARWREVYPDHHRGHFLYMTPLLDDLVGDTRPALLLLFGAVGFVLLIACANVASLLLARGQYRSREMAVRAALGAGRVRLVSHLLAEAGILALMGGVMGLLVAVLGVDLLLSLAGGSIPRVDNVGVNGGVVAFAALLVAGTTLVFGLVPAGAVARATLTGALADGGKREGSSAGRLRLRKTLVVSEVTLAVVLVVGAGLMAKSVRRTVQQDPGFEVENLLVSRFTLPEARYTADEKVAFLQALTERLARDPRVVGTAVAGRPPLLYDESWTRFTLPDRLQPGEGEPSPTGSLVMAGAELFETLGIPLVRGRIFNAADDGDSPGVVVIDETMAERYWPGEDPLGERIWFGSEEGQEIVGIVAPARWDGLTRQAPTFYILDRQVVREAPFVLGTPTLLTRSRGDPLDVAGVVRDVIRSLDPGVPVFAMRPMRDVVAGTVAGPRAILTLLAVFAGVALLLGAVGIYGVISQAVSQRTNEIGIRRALGAHEADVVGLIMRQGAMVVGVGLLLGLGAAAVLGRVMASFLYEVSSTDPATYATVILCVSTVAVVAILVPARRASRVDPMEALRAE